MSNYRTTSLFHYTKEVDNLFNILQSGKLIPNYCKEDLTTSENPDFIWGIPMICFCDIPISLANNFLSNYGHYAIGFNKNWGITNGCNPIQYVSNENILFSLHHFLTRIITLQEIEIGELLEYVEKLRVFVEEDTAKQIKKFKENNEKLKPLYDKLFQDTKNLFNGQMDNSGNNNYDKEIQEALVRQQESLLDTIKYQQQVDDLDNIHKSIMNSMSLIPKDNKSYLYYLGFLKKYESEWKGKPYDNYNENEWRYIVEETDSIKWLYNEDYEKWRGDKENNPKPKPTEALIEKSLKFSVSDINHIILYEESEIPAFIRRIRELEKIGDTALDANTKDILISKISSFERIKKDY